MSLRGWRVHRTGRSRLRARRLSLLLRPSGYYLPHLGCLENKVVGCTHTCPHYKIKDSVGFYQEFSNRRTQKPRQSVLMKHLLRCVMRFFGFDADWGRSESQVGRWRRGMRGPLLEREFNHIRIQNRQNNPEPTSSRHLPLLYQVRIWPVSLW